MKWKWQMQRYAIYITVLVVVAALVACCDDNGNDNKCLNSFRRHFTYAANGMGMCLFAHFTQEHTHGSRLVQTPTDSNAVMWRSQQHLCDFIDSLLRISFVLNIAKATAHYCHYCCYYCCYRDYFLEIATVSYPQTQKTLCAMHFINFNFRYDFVVVGCVPIILKAVAPIPTVITFSLSVTSLRLLCTTLCHWNPFSHFRFMHRHRHKALAFRTFSISQLQLRCFDILLPRCNHFSSTTNKREPKIMHCEFIKYHLDFCSEIQNHLSFFCVCCAGSVFETMESRWIAYQLSHAQCALIPYRIFMWLLHLLLE